ncbi:MAG: multiple sugar transport system permease protein [Abditibacteriota bacterium]|nr:multiple sugar transport system permease protein [Abditibacteriota bacterium]
MNRKDWAQLGKGLGFLSPWLIGFFAFTLIPVGLSFYYSLCEYSLLQKPLYIGLDNYRQLWADPIFWKALTNTFYYALMALPSGMMVSLGLALLLNADIRGQAIYRTIIFLPSLVPTVASAMLWLWLFNAKLGLINNLLGKVGIEGPGWLTTPEWALPALAFMSLWGVGHTVVIYLAGLQDVPRELYEAAEIDGARSWRRLWHITLPMLSPVIFFNLVMALIGTMQVFAVPYIMTGGGPTRSTYFFTMYLYDNAFTYLKMGYASAMAWVQLLIILCLTGFSFWSSRKWVHYQSK